MCSFVILNLFLIFALYIQLYMKYQLEQCIGSRMRALSRKVDSLYRKELGHSGVTENQLSIMMALYKMGTTEQKTLGEFLILEKSSLSRNLVRLIDAGYIQKSGAVNRPKLAITPTGKQKVEGLIPAWETVMDTMHQVLDEQDIDAFMRIENRIANL